MFVLLVASLLLRSMCTRGGGVDMIFSEHYICPCGDSEGIMVITAGKYTAFYTSQAIILIICVFYRFQACVLNCKCLFV